MRNRFCCDVPPTWDLRVAKLELAVSSRVLSPKREIAVWLSAGDSGDLRPLRPRGWMGAGRADARQDLRASALPGEPETRAVTRRKALTTSAAAPYNFVKASSCAWRMRISLYGFRSCKTP